MNSNETIDDIILVMLNKIITSNVFELVIQDNPLTLCGQIHIFVLYCCRTASVDLIMLAN